MRPAPDNALLSACDQLHRKTILGAFALFAAVGAFWYLCVLIRA
jgi:hypothetical protein